MVSIETGRPTAAIVGTGAYLPATVRTNDWWPREIVAAWEERLREVFPRRDDNDETSCTGKLRVLDAIAEGRSDPFAGVVSRHVATAEQKASELEESASRVALARAQLRPDQIDIVLTESMVPDYLAVNQATIVHHRLGLRRDCLALQTQGICISLIAQLELATSLLCSGRARYALLVQSSTVCRLMRPEQPYSAFHGDGATAIVVALSTGNRGLIGTEYDVDGSMHKGFVYGPGPGQNWYADGSMYAYPDDRRETRSMILNSADSAKNLISKLLSSQSTKPDAVDFYCSHQPLGWFRRVTQSHSGLETARYLDTYAWTGSLICSNLAVQLWAAENNGTLRSGDLVMMFALAAGVKGAAALVRWGS